jgi:hypothetical protein
MGFRRGGGGKEGDAGNLEVLFSVLSTIVVGKLVGEQETANQELEEYVVPIPGETAKSEADAKAETR